MTLRVIQSQEPGAYPGHVVVRQVPGNRFAEIFEDLFPLTTYNVSVEAGYAGNFGPAVWEVITTEEPGGINGINGME